MIHCGGGGRSSLMIHLRLSRGGTLGRPNFGVVSKSSDRVSRSLAWKDSVSRETSIECRCVELSIRPADGKLFPVLKSCSLHIPTGELWMLLGPNGCGKSTLLKVLAGLYKPDRGMLYVRKPRSFIFQNPDHQVVMPTVGADVAFGLGKFNLTSSEVWSRVSEALSDVGMLDFIERPIQTLSGGQKQRVAIAGALAERSKVLLLDELTTFLDERDQAAVISAVKKSLLRSGDVTALWVTHRLEELERADGAIYMEDGRIIMHGDVSTMMDLVKAKQASYIPHCYS